MRIIPAARTTEVNPQLARCARSVPFFDLARTLVLSQPGNSVAIISQKQTAEAQSRNQNANRPSIARLLFLLTISTVLVLSGAWPSKAAGADFSAQSTSQGAPPNLGSVTEYMSKGGNPALVSYLPLLGVHVFEGHGDLVSGQRFKGLNVTSIDQGGPADMAGFRAERVQVFRAATEAGASVLLAGAILLFPPAVFGISLIPDKDDVKAYDVIVAVDSVRTRNFNELADSLRNVKAGETIYLTVVRDGAREQLRLVAPPISDSLNPASRLPLSE